MVMVLMMSVEDGDSDRDNEGCDDPDQWVFTENLHVSEVGIPVLLIPPQLSDPVPVQRPQQAASAPYLPFFLQDAPVRSDTSFQGPLLFTPSFPKPGSVSNPHILVYMCAHVHMWVCWKVGQGRSLCGSTLVFAVMTREAVAPGTSVLAEGSLL